MKKVLQLFVVLFCISPLFANVGNDGNFSYSIDIEIPEGTAKMQPKLSLQYSSAAGIGVAGRGWNLAGLATISRDVTNGPYYWEDTASFIGPSGRIYKDSDGYYYAEKYDYCTYEKTDNGWKIYSPDGSIQTYGSNWEDNTWYLTEVKDANGNYYTIVYTEYSDTYYPSVITYTQNDSSNISKYKTVKFTYSEKGPSHKFYIGGSLSREEKVRLDNIKIYYDITQWRQYDLVYDENSEYLKDISYFKDSDSPKRSYSFTYNTGNDTENEVNYEFNGDLGVGYKRKLIAIPDLNGDGCADLVFHDPQENTDTDNNNHLKYCLNKGNDTPSFGTELKDNIFYNNKYEARYLFFDADGDGLDEIIYWDAFSDQGAWAIYKYNHTEDDGWTDSWKGYNTGYKHPYSDSDDNYMQMFLADLNGDTLADPIFWMKEWESSLGYTSTQECPEGAPTNSTECSWTTTYHDGYPVPYNFNLSESDFDAIGDNDDGFFFVDFANRSFDKSYMPVNGHVAPTDSVSKIWMNNAFKLNNTINSGENSTLWQFIDINSDGYADLYRWRCSYLYSINQQTHASNMFSSIKEDQSVPMGGSFTFDVDRTEKSKRTEIIWSDLNADGHVDKIVYYKPFSESDTNPDYDPYDDDTTNDNSTIIKYFHGVLWYTLNRGDGTFKSLGYEQLGSTGLYENGECVFSDVSNGSDDCQQKFLFVDMTGDGFPDKVELNAIDGKIYVYKSSGDEAGFYPSASTKSYTYSTNRKQLNFETVHVGDANGDGHADVLFQHKADGYQYNVSALISRMAVEEKKLSGITQPDTSTVSIEYRNNNYAYENANIPAFPYRKGQAVQTVVKSISTDNHVSKTTKTYTYKHPVNYVGDPKHRTPLGFSKVIEESVTSNNDGSFSTKTETQYKTDNFLLAGRITHQTQYVEGKKVKEVSYTYNELAVDTAYSITGRYAVQVTSKTETSYIDGKDVNGAISSTTLTNKTDYVYNSSNGSIEKETISKGMESEVFEIIELSTEYTANYTTNEDGIVKNRPSKITKKLVDITDVNDEDKKKVLSEEYLHYDGINVTERIRKIQEGEYAAEFYEYDAVGNVTKSYKPAEKFQTVDSISKTSSQTVNIVSIDYDIEYCMLPKTITQEGLPSQTKEYYDTTGLLYKETDINGNKKIYEYDDWGRTTKVYLSPKTHWGEEGRVISEKVYKDPGEYDTVGGRTEKTTEYVYNDKGEQLNTKVVTVYVNGAGNQYKVVQEITIQEESLTQTVLMEYDVRGRLKRKSNPYFNDETAYYHEYSYDTYNRETGHTYPDGRQVNTYYPVDATSKELQKVIIKKGLDVNNLLVTTHEITSYMGPNGKLKRVDNNGTVKYEYDDAGRMVKITGSGDSIDYECEYDMLGRKQWVTTADTGKTEHEYDARGNMTWQKDAKGTETTITYDAMDRITLVDYSDSTPDVHYKYSNRLTPAKQSAGRVIEMDDGVSVSKFSYHYTGKPQHKRVVIGDKKMLFQMRYDSMGRVIATRYPEGSWFYREYHDIEALYKITWKNKGEEHLVVKYFHDEEDYIAVRETGNGIKTEIAYDPSSNTPTGIISVNTHNDEIIDNDVQIENLSFGYDAARNIAEITDNDLNNGNKRSQSLTYDSMNRLDFAKSDTTYGEIDYTYSENDNGNLTVKGDKKLEYTDTDHPHAVTGVYKDNKSLYLYEYDANGNMSKRTTFDPKTTGNPIKKIDRFVYDAKNRLTAITDDNDITKEQYTYDGNGRRIKTWRSDGTTTINIDKMYEITYIPGELPRYTKYVYGFQNELVLQHTVTDVIHVTEETAGVAAYIYNDSLWGTLAKLKVYLSFTIKQNRYQNLAVLIMGLFVFLLLGGIVLLGERQRIVTRLVSVTIITMLFMALTGCNDKENDTKKTPPWEETEDNIAGKPDDGTDSTEAGDPVDSGYSAYPVPGAIFFHPDYTGNIAYTTDSYGDVTSINYFKPYGERWQLEDRTGDGTGNSYHAKFNQKSFNEETGLSHFGFRFYDPVIGRFIQPDTMIADKYDTQGLNPYSFCAGSPVNFQDKSGNFPQLVIMVAFCMMMGGAIASSIGEKYGIGWLKTVGMVSMGAGAAIFAGIAIAYTLGSLGVLHFAGMIGSAPQATGLAAFSGVKFSADTVLATVLGTMGAIGGYNSDQNGRNTGQAFAESLLLGSAIGSNVITFALYAAYLARIIVVGTVCVGFHGSAWLLGDDGLKKRSVRRGLDCTFGKEHTFDTNRGRRTLRSRPWVPGDPHTTGVLNGDDSTFGNGDNAFLMILLDVLGTHQTSIVHDEACEDNRPIDDEFDLSGYASSFFSSFFGADNNGYLGNDWIHEGELKW